MKVVSSFRLMWWMHLGIVAFVVVLFAALTAIGVWIIRDPEMVKRTPDFLSWITMVAILAVVHQVQVVIFLLGYLWYRTYVWEINDEGIEARRFGWLAYSYRWDEIYCVRLAAAGLILHPIKGRPRYMFLVDRNIARNLIPADKQITL